MALNEGKISLIEKLLSFSTIFVFIERKESNHEIKCMVAISLERLPIAVGRG